MANPIRGLTAAEVAERVAQGKINAASTLKTKSISRIFYDNICTLFNLINVILFVALLLVGSFKNLLFIGVVFFNTVIGIVQEIRSKQSVDKLTILTASKISVLRDGALTEVSKDELVLDDVIQLSRGSQIPADCQLLEGECKVNESLLTGESDLIAKGEGDELLSGSFIAAGTCYAKITKVGADCYAAKINNEAKYIKKNNSQILISFKFIIKLCTIIIFPIGALLFGSQFFFRHADLQSAVVGTVAALVGMIPGGMILLTSTVLAVSIIRLARKKVLVNEMYCIETLARVDVICLDKTGTLTADAMHVSDIHLFDAKENEVKTALASLHHASTEVNATMQAIGDYIEKVDPLDVHAFAPFSSETKWSGGQFADGKTYILGAAEFVFSDKEKYKEVFEAIEQIAETVRIVVLAVTDKPLSDNQLPAGLKPMALVLIKDTLRENVNQTVNYFMEQGDGVNDVLALKEADCSIAMASGSEAARNVSQLVLVDNDFGSMPEVVAEGRRTINNIERSSSLYLVKTIYSILLSLIFTFFALQYPFEPIQLTLIGGLTIGFPSFVLALQPNKNIVRGNFTKNIIARALPAALCVVLNVLAAAILSVTLQMPHAEISTIAVYVTSLTCYLLVLRLSIPINALRTTMLALSLSGLTIAFIFFGKLFNLVFLSPAAILALCIMSCCTLVIFNILYNIADKMIERDKNYSVSEK